MQTINIVPTPPFKPDATNDPLVGTQEHPDEAAEVLAGPVSEAAAWPTAGAPQRSRMIAGLLGLALGTVGAHRFYLAFGKVGLCQLAMFLLSFGTVVMVGVATGMPRSSMFLIAGFTAMLVWLWGAVEGAMILLGMMPHDGHGHPLR